MLIKGEGNLLNAEAEALVNTVNTVGVMGKGVALQFKRAFPEMFKQYYRACKEGRVTPGKMFVYEVKGLDNPTLIINFPTKRHWRENSRIGDISEGLHELKKVIDERKIKSIALPPLGCGLGGLNWSDVFPMIENTFQDRPDLKVIVFPPATSTESFSSVARTPKPKLTWIKSAIIKICDRYTRFDYNLTNIEIQKLLYFYQESGEDLKLKFVKRYYGPYADNLHHALIDLDGHYLTGLSTGSNAPTAKIKINPDILDEVNQYIDYYKNTHPISEKRMNDVIKLIRGFETPYGLELLSTVHWVCVKENNQITSLEDTIKAVQEWNPRKKTMMKPKHIEIALNHLQSEGWIQLQNN